MPRRRSKSLGRTTFDQNARLGYRSSRCTPIAFTNTGAVAGLDQGGAPIIVPMGLMADGATVMFALQLPPWLVAPGTQPVDGIAVNGFVYHVPSGQAGSVLGYLEGTLTLNQAAMTNGAPVTGTLSARLLWWF